MTTNLTVTVDGQPTPLDDCGWIERRPCGCVIAALVAVSGNRVYATPEQAHAHLNPTKRDRDRAQREEITTELITMDHYDKHLRRQPWECAQHRKVSAS